MAQPAKTKTATPGYEVVRMISAKSIAARIEELAREIEQAFADTDKRGRGWAFCAAVSSSSPTSCAKLDLPVEGRFPRGLQLRQRDGKLARGAHPEGPARRDRRPRRAGGSRISSTPATRCTNVVNLLRSKGPARLRTIALLDKPTRREVDIKADWTGFEIPDEFGRRLRHRLRSTQPQPALYRKGAHARRQGGLMHTVPDADAFCGCETRPRANSRSPSR